MTKLEEKIEKINKEFDEDIAEALKEIALWTYETVRPEEEYAKNVREFMRRSKWNDCIDKITTNAREAGIIITE